jgi:hypothetical protein
MGAAAGPLIHGHLRFVVIDGSTVQGPGANGTGYRLHIAVDGVKWHLIHVEGSDKHSGEQLGDSPLQEGDVGVMDRGYHPAKGLIEQTDPGVSGVLRYHPHSLNVWEAAGEKIDGYERLRATAQTSHCLPVRVREGGASIEGYVHAWRLPPAQAAEARPEVAKPVLR